MCNSEAPSTSSPVILGQNDPEITDVLKTLRILSHASIARKNAAAMLSTTGHGSRCHNCSAMLTTSTTGPRSREEILRNLNQLEVTLQAKGEQLPGWVQAYKEGDSLTAAKLLHVSFLNRNKARNAIKRSVEVSPATSTTVTTDLASEENVESNLNSPAPSNKRRRSSVIASSSDE